MDVWTRRSLENKQQSLFDIRYYPKLYEFGEFAKKIGKFRFLGWWTLLKVRSARIS